MGTIKWNNSYIGKKFGYLTIIGLSPGRGYGGSIHVKCKCKCGKIIEPRFYCLRKEGQTSCGCKHKFKHGYSETRLYHNYHTMISRCTDPNSMSYKHYGGRGITVCKEWSEGFLTFRFQMRKKLIDAKKKYKYELLTIERIDNNKGYYYDNCIFIPLRLQAKNRRNVYPVKAINRKTRKGVYGENQLELSNKINLSTSFINQVIHNKRRSRKWIMRPLLTLNKRKE